MSDHPVVTLKVATSLDGRIALSNGVSQWITNSESRARTHQMRAEHDAVLVGVGTVLADDPLLTARTIPMPARQPVRIVADSKLRTPAHSRLVQSVSTGRVVLAHADQERSTHRGGVDLWAAGDGNGRVSPEQLLRRARAEGLQSIFLEGGGQLAASFLRAGLVNKIHWFRAPIIIGGDGIPALAALGLTAMDQASRWKLAGREDIGADCLETWTAT